MTFVIVEVISRYSALVSAAVFFGFFAISIVALIFRDREVVRRSYVGFLLCLLIGSSLTGLQPIPIVHAHEYSGIAPEQHVHYDLRVVGEDGNELPYDPQAMPPVIQNEELAANMGKVGDGSERTQITYTPSQRREVAAFLLENAREYRRQLEGGRNPLTALTFPPHNLRDRWTVKELNRVSRFVGIRVYRVEMTFTSDGRRVVVDREKLVYEYRQGGNGTT